MKYKTAEDNYVSPVSEVVGIIYEGAMLTDSVDAGLGFTFDDEEMTEGDTIIIGG